MTGTTSLSDISLDELFELTNAKPKTALAYRRVSSLSEKRRQQGEITTESQKDYIDAFARREGITIVDWVDDLNISGRRDKFLQRKIMPTIERVKAGEADCVIVYNVSRWGRSSVESQLSEAALWEAGGRLLSATEPNDEKTTVGQFTRQQLFSMAELQSNQIRDSWKAAHQNRLKKGLPHNGKPRFGYSYIKHSVGNAEYVVDPKTGPLLAEAYRCFLEGESLHSVTRRFRARGVSLPSNPEKLITYMVLRDALDGGFGAGKLVVNTKSGKVTDRRYAPGAQKPVITPEEWERYLKKRHQEVGSKVGRPKRPKIALQGLVKCGGCKRPMAVQRREDGDKYACIHNTRDSSSSRPRCEHPTGIRAEKVDRAVMMWLRSFTMSTEALDQVRLQRGLAALNAEVDVDVLEKKLNGLKSARRNYLRMRANETIGSDEELAEMLVEVDAEIKEVEEALHENQRTLSIHKLPEMDLFEGVLAGWLVGMSGPTLNQGLSKAIEGVYIGKGKKSDVGNGKIDIIGSWEKREPKVFLAPVRKIDHNVGKHCSRCLDWKDADQFYRRKRGRDEGVLSSWCKPCHTGYVRNEYRKGQAVKTAYVKRDRRTVYEHGHRSGDQVRTADGLIWTRGTKLWHREGRPRQSKYGRTWEQLNEEHGPLEWLGSPEEG